MEIRNKKYTKQTYDVSPNSFRIANGAPAVMQSHKYYLRLIGHEEVGNNYYTETAYHNVYMLNYTIEGEAKMVYDNATYHLKQGDLVLLHKHPRFILTPLNKNNYDWKILFLHILGDDIKDMFNEIRQNNLVILHDFPMEKISVPFDQITEEARKGNEGSENRISAQIYSILLEIRDFAQKGETDACPALVHVLDYIRDNYLSPIMLDDIVKYTYISKSHINALFIKHLGVTPMQYVMRLRIQKAQELLCTTNLTIKAIATMCGFKDDRSMIYVFKAHCEMTPQQVRFSAKKPVAVSPPAAN